jgi:hypothetical protein
MTAKRKARRYDRNGGQPAGWTCTLAREEFAPRLFSCAVRIDGKLREDAVFALEVKRKRPSGQRCDTFTVGPDTFFNITARGVSCRSAKRLLDRATLSSNRRNRRRWPFANFRWTFTPKTETSALITGQRGSQLIRAGLAKR